MYDDFGSQARAEAAWRKLHPELRYSDTLNAPPSKTSPLGVVSSFLLLFVGVLLFKGAKALIDYVMPLLVRGVVSFKIQILLGATSVIFGMGFYNFKKASPLYYGLIELGVAVGIGVSATEWAKLMTAVYLVVRGLDNIGTRGRKTREHAELLAMMKKMLAAPSSPSSTADV